MPYYWNLNPDYVNKYLNFLKKNYLKIFSINLKYFIYTWNLTCKLNLDKYSLSLI